MKLLFSLVAMLGLPACIITSDDDPNNPAPFCGDNRVDAGEECDDGNSIADDGCTACSIDAPTGALLTAVWTLQNVDGTATACPSGFDTAAVYSQPVDGQNAPVGQPIIDLFNCGDFTGVTAPLDPGVYQVWVEITNTNNTSTYAQSVSAIVDLTIADKTFSAAILNDGGYFALSWELVDAANGDAPLACADVAELDGIGVVSTLVANQTTYLDDKFTCADHYGITGALLAGTYSVEVDAFNDTTGSISPAPVDLENRVITAPNRVTDLGTVIIPIE